MAKQSGRMGGVMEIFSGLLEIIENEVEKFREASTSLGGNSLEMGTGTGVVAGLLSCSALLFRMTVSDDSFLRFSCSILVNVSPP